MICNLNQNQNAKRCFFGYGPVIRVQLDKFILRIMLLFSSLGFSLSIMVLIFLHYDAERLTCHADSFCSRGWHGLSPFCG